MSPPIYRQYGYNSIVGCGDRVYQGPTPSDSTDTQTQAGAAMGALMHAVAPLYEAKMARARRGGRTPQFYMLDYGAGRHSRHANFFRQFEGVKVFAYDPFKAQGGSGWGMGDVLDEPPKRKRFDLVFSAYVMNVVTEDIQDSEILPLAESFGPNVVHIVRDDLKGEVRRWLRNPNHVTTKWFLDMFADSSEKREWENNGGRISDETMENFLCFGFETTKGFQRKVDLSENGYELNRKLSRPGSWKFWSKGI